MPANARLRELLLGEFPALYVEAGSIPEALSAFGAGRQYHIAVLSPHGLNPLADGEAVALLHAKGNEWHMTAFAATHHLGRDWTTMDIPATRRMGAALSALASN
jgi:hypothetical protein